MDGNKNFVSLTSVIFSSELRNNETVIYKSDLPFLGEKASANKYNKNFEKIVYSDNKAVEDNVALDETGLLETISMDFNDIEEVSQSPSLANIIPIQQNINEASNSSENDFFLEEEFEEELEEFIEEFEDEEFFDDLEEEELEELFEEYEDEFEDFIEEFEEEFEDEEFEEEEFEDMDFHLLDESHEEILYDGLTETEIIELFVDLTGDTEEQIYQTIDNEYDGDIIQYYDAFFGG